MTRDPQERLERAFGWLMVAVIGCGLTLFGATAYLLWRLVRAIVWGM